MKSLALFLIFLGFSFATYTPQWEVTNPFNNAFKPTNVTASMKPIILSFDKVTICGDVQTDFTVEKFSYEIIQTDRIASNGTKELTQEDVKAGTQYCFSDRFFVAPYLSGSGFILRMTLESADEQICTVDVYMPEVANASGKNLDFLGK